MTPRKMLGLNKLNTKVNELEFKMMQLAGLGGIPNIGSTEPSECNYAHQEKNMNETINTYVHERSSLRSAIHAARHEKDKELRKTYNIDCDQPRSPKEVIVAIQNGKFKYRDEGKHMNEDSYYCEPFNGICFCDPDKEPDYVGYRKANEAMEEDTRKVFLDISVLEPEKALKAFRSYEERKYH
jgi:hypothetical protein